MKVFVCGSIGYGYKEEIIKIQNILKSEGFEVLDQLDYDYSHVEDFRNKKDLCVEIVRRDLELCDRADVIILIAKNPSFGAMAEAVISAMKGKYIVAYCPEAVRSPWPIYFSNEIARSEEELIKILRKLKGDGIRTIPNVYCEHLSEFTYEKFTCICPVTGMRDHAKIKIRYKPKGRILEYESLERYFKSFENRRMHHEAVVCKIYGDLFKALDPDWLEVVAEFEERSSVKAVVRVTKKR